MRHDIPNQWEEFFHNSKQSLENAAYQDAIAQCSLALDELTQKTVATLDVRAMAFGQSANYDQGMHDALQMIKLAPSFPKGYLRSGQLYAMQGKHQLAIDMYNQGIQAVIPLQSDNNNDPDYHQLFVQRQASLDQQNRRVDFITQLPFDILPKIMSYLLPYMCAVCVDVSHSWRSRIQQCSPIWRKLIIDHSDSDDAKIYHNLAHVSDQVRELSLRGFINHIPSEFLQTLATGHFTNLQSLALRRKLYLFYFIFGRKNKKEEI
ncbi:hypothetical protein BDA99DRAFT_224649 [Phascolomyces articulosus]|uniref:F-box domain-containing protein n=1 Tax=Phascolomyces articulosus TaxID=60185 RepID=A0AAD5P918_9FUNG|nr:hypothetical protein BDA99DRAFT_224649 [Phascolomyces articulosus]